MKRDRWPTAPRPGPAPVERLLYTPREAMQAMGITGSLKVFYRLAAAGHIPVIHVGRRLRVPRKSLEAWIETQIRRSA